MPSKDKGGREARKPKKAQVKKGQTPAPTQPLMGPSAGPSAGTAKGERSAGGAA